MKHEESSKGAATGESHQQSRVVTREHPMAGTALNMGGLDYLRAVKEGLIPPPPVWSLVNCRILEIDEGFVTLGITPAPCHYNRFGRVQGGIMCTVLDAAMACAVSSVLPPGTDFSSPELKVQYFRPVTAKTGPLRCQGRIIDRGDLIVVAEATMVDNSDRLYACGTSAMMVSGPVQDDAAR